MSSDLSISRPIPPAQLQISLIPYVPSFSLSSGIQYYLSLPVLYREDQPLTGTNVNGKSVDTGYDTGTVPVCKHARLSAGYRCGTGTVCLHARLSAGYRYAVPVMYVYMHVYRLRVVPSDEDRWRGDQERLLNREHGTATQAPPPARHPDQRLHRRHPPIVGPSWMRKSLVIQSIIV
jgi:hypothetical protein